MKLSVVVCAKNEEKYLPACLNALKKQILKTEVIVINDKSTDKTPQIARKFGFKVVQGSGTGIKDARNLGWKSASGDVIAYCDADSIAPRDWTARIMRHFQDEPELLALSGPLNAYDGDFKLKLSFRLWAELFPSFFAMIGKHYLWGANMIIRRPVLQKFPFRFDFLEDYDLGKRLRHCGFGKVRFDYKLKMMTSTRRFGEGFHAKAIKFIVRDWFLLNFRMDVKKGYFKK